MTPRTRTRGRSRLVLPAVAAAVALACSSCAAEQAGAPAARVTAPAASTADTGTARPAATVPTVTPTAPQVATPTSARSTPGPAAPARAPASASGTPDRQPATPTLVGGTARSVLAGPERLTVDAAGIDEPLVPRGVSADGTITPARGELIWFTGHGRVPPGRRGTAVVAGHVSYGGQPDVLADLDQVGVGDEVRLQVSGGRELRYQVTDVDVVSKAELPDDERVWGPHGRSSRLVLITCDDELGYRADGHRAANLVVVAHRVP